MALRSGIGITEETDKEKKQKTKVQDTSNSAFVDLDETNMYD